jgi:regulatory protein
VVPFNRSKPVNTDSTAARSVAVSWLARRDYASTELRKKLVSRGFGPEATDSAIAALVEERALDDARFAGNYVSYRIAKGQGPYRIRSDLRALGLAAETIESALTAAADWARLARQARVRKFGAAVPTGRAEAARQARFLQYRGFSSDDIRSALDADFDPDGES